MQRVHFIAIGGSATLEIALATSKKSNFRVTGSDVEITEAAAMKLQEYGLLPEKLGWFPAERINKQVNAVVLGVGTSIDNPELLRARELGLKIYSIPEFIFQQTRSKTRIVVAGTKGKTTIVALILYVLKQVNMDADYMVNSTVKGLQNKVKLSFDSRIVVLEGDEYTTSALDTRPKFHLYKPHIAVITGIQQDEKSTYGNFDSYLEQFKQFIELMEVQGRLVYYDGDTNLVQMTEKLRRDIVPFPYNSHETIMENGQTYLLTKKGNVAFGFTSDEYLQYVNAARLACRQIGVSDEQFYSVISGFEGV